MTEATAPTPPATTWTRRAALAVVSLAGVPLLLLYGYLLAWFGPYATPAGTQRLPGQAPAPAHATVLWYGLLVAVAGGTLCLVLAFVRLRRPGSWWLLPGGVLACLAAGALVPARLY